MPDYSSYSVKLYRDIESCRNQWVSLQPLHDIFLQYKFLKTLDFAGPEEIDFYYAIVFKDESPVGILHLQSKLFRASSAVRGAKGGFLSGVKERIASILKGRMLIAGNLLVTGQHGCHFPRIPSEKIELGPLLQHLYDQIIGILEEEGVHHVFLLVKDFYGSKPINTVDSGRLQSFSVQPNMVAFLDPNWTDFQDYLADMRSKYRVRAKKAIDRAGDLVIEEWDENKIRENKIIIHRLYQNVSDQAGFNLFKLNADYWAALKSNLGDSFTLYAYMNGDQVVGFFTTIEQEQELNAHFLGYETNTIKTYDLYMNMLLKLIELAIEARKKWVMMSRTAMEIKSAVGAIPLDMYCLYSHRSALGRKAFPFLLNLLNPTISWDQRHPFKNAPSALPVNFLERKSSVKSDFTSG